MKNKLDKLKKFMNEQPNSNVSVHKIISCEVSPFDDDIGFIGENYIIKFDGHQRIRNDSSTVESITTIVLEDKTAYVNVKEFKRWLQQENAVRYELN